MIIKMDRNHIDADYFPPEPPTLTNMTLVVCFEPEKVFKILPLYRCGRCHKFIRIFKRPERCKHCDTRIFWK